MKCAVELRVFQERNVTISDNALECGSPTKNSVIPKREPERLHAQVPERITHPIHEWARRKAQSKTSPCDTRIGQHPAHLERGVFRQAQIGVDKP
ncbi:MAG: hypothetical protein QOH88_1695 [Verrucomicrobiota bacterium]